MTNTKDNSADGKAVWVMPDIRELDIRETTAFPNLGADVPGNPSPDCQRS